MVRERDFVDECYADKDLSLLKKLTLVIPTYNRNYYLSRCLWYHAHFPFGQIIVADSSPEEKKVVNRETVAKVREMFGADILYLEYEPETDKYGEDIYEKWADAVMHVETEYSKISTDKEFIIPTAISNIINHLDQHLDYMTSDGISLFVQVSNDDDAWYIWTPEDKSYCDNNLLTRMNEVYLSSGNRQGRLNTLTGVRRTSFQKWIYRKLVCYSLTDIRFGDNVPQILSILQSKRRRFNEEYLVRDLTEYRNNEIVVSSESSCFRYPHVIDYCRDKIMNKKMLSLCTLLNDMLTDFDGVDDKMKENCIKLVCVSILRLFGIENYLNPVFRFLYSSKVLYYIYTHTLSVIINLVRRPRGYVSGITADSSPANNIVNISEATLIARVISLTRDNHKDDKSIFLDGGFIFLRN